MRSPQRRLCIIGLVTALSFGGVSPAAAAPAVVADGTRWAAWSTGPTQAVVYDDRTQRQRKIRVPDCPLSAVGAGRLLMSCAGAPAPLPVVVDIRTGERTELSQVESEPAFLDGTTTWIGVGGRGILATIADNHASVETGFDESSGTVRALDDPTTAIDLDAPQLARPLCDPLRRTRTPDDPTGQRFPDPYVLIAYARPWAVETVPVYRVEDGTLIEESRIRAWRCGERRPRILAKRCVCRASFGAGLVAWRHRIAREADPRRVRAVDLASGRRRSWRVGERQEVAQAGRTLVLWAPGANRGRPPSRLRLIRWPKPAPSD